MTARYSPLGWPGYTGGMDGIVVRRRWFHLTPDRLILGLLAVEGVLFLSEQFHWFPKGGAVVTAVAAVAVAMLLMLLWFIGAMLFHWRFQFSLRSLLVLTLTVAIPCSWLAVEIKKAKEQREKVTAILKLGGTAYFDYQVDEFGYPNMGNEPTWACKLVGNDLGADVGAVYLTETQATDADLAHSATCPDSDDCASRGLG